MSHEKYEEYQDCIAACHACAVACNHCAAACLQEPHVKDMVRCIGLDSDCAQACQLAAAPDPALTALLDAQDVDFRLHERWLYEAEPVESACPSTTIVVSG